MYRGYDSPQLLREDTIKRMRWLDSELYRVQCQERSTKGSIKPSSDDDDDPNTGDEDLN